MSFRTARARVPTIPRLAYNRLYWCNHRPSNPAFQLNQDAPAPAPQLASRNLFQASHFPAYSVSSANTVFPSPPWIVRSTRRSGRPSASECPARASDWLQPAATWLDCDSCRRCRCALRRYPNPPACPRAAPATVCTAFQPRRNSRRSDNTPPANTRRAASPATSRPSPPSTAPPLPCNAVPPRQNASVLRRLAPAKTQFPHAASAQRASAPPQSARTQTVLPRLYNRLFEMPRGRAKDTCRQKSRYRPGEPPVQAIAENAARSPPHRQSQRPTP